MNGQYALLFLICLAGVFLANLLPFPLPASICAMALTVCLLASRALKPTSLQGVSDYLLGNMAVFFVPPGVEILAHLDELKGVALPLLFICVVTTVLTFLATAATVHATRRWRRATGEDGGAQR